MSRVLWIDANAGLAGDMLCGALLDAGGRLESLRATAADLGLKAKLRATTVKRGAFAATHFVVEPLEDEPEHRHFSQIREMILASKLTDSVKEKAVHVFSRLAEAEAKVHGVSIEAVHFHEVGAIDSIIDIVGFCVLLEELEVDNVVSSPIAVGEGRVDAAHGSLSLPVPAVLKLCEGRTLYQSGRPMEQCTPTGAALISSLAEEGPMPTMRPLSQGHGAGTRNPPSHANLTRVVLGEAAVVSGNDEEAVCELDCQVDDMIPEIIPELIDVLLSGGALDAIATPTMMKKKRPGFAIKVICTPERSEELTQLLFEHSSTLGVRKQTLTRTVLNREFRSVETPWGSCRIKVGLRNGELLNQAPEFEDCKKLAQKAGVPIKTVYAWAMAECLKGAS